MGPTGAGLSLSLDTRHFDRDAERSAQVEKAARSIARFADAPPADRRLRALFDVGEEPAVELAGLRSTSASPAAICVGDAHDARIARELVARGVDEPRELIGQSVMPQPMRTLGKNSWMGALRRLFRGGGALRRPASAASRGAIFLHVGRRHLAARSR